MFQWIECILDIAWYWGPKIFAVFALAGLWAALMVTWNTYDAMDSIEYRDEYGTLQGTCKHEHSKVMQFMWPESDTHMICTSSGVNSRLGYRFATNPRQSALDKRYRSMTE